MPLNTVNLKHDFNFVTYLPEIPHIRPDGFQRFIAIAPTNGRTLENAETIRAVEGVVGYDISEDGHIASLIHFSQLIPKENEVGRYKSQTLQITLINPFTVTPTPISEVLSDPSYTRDLIAQGATQIGHDYHRRDSNSFEIKRAIGGKLAFKFLEHSNYEALNEIKETPGVEPSVNELYWPGEPKPYEAAVKKTQQAGGLLGFTLP